MTVNRKELHEALKRVKSVVTSTGLSVLSQIRLNHGELQATDLKRQVIVPIVDMGFDVCVDYREFMSLISKTRFDELEVSLVVAPGGEGKKLRVKSGDYDASFALGDPEKFPVFTKPDLEKFVKMPPELRVGFGHCLSFASTEVSRFFLNSVYVKNDDVVSTDGRRLALYKIPEGHFVDGILLPADLVHGVMEMSLDSYLIEEKGIWFHGDDGYLFGSLMDSPFVEYMKVIPNEDKEPLVTMEITKEQMAGSDIVRVFGMDNMSVDVEIVGDKLQMNSVTDRGSVRFETKIEDRATDAPDARFRINYGFLMDALKEEQMILKLYEAGHGKMVKLTAGAFLAVIMGVSEE